MPIQNIDLARLSLKDALDLAVLIEQEAHERYLELADQMDQHRTPEAPRFFRYMAENEAHHREELNGRRRGLFGDTPRSVRSTMIFEVEAPDYDEARAFMTARQALEIALCCERKAHAFFVEALPHVQEPQVRTLFAELRDEEVHIRSSCSVNCVGYLQARISAASPSSTSQAPNSEPLRPFLRLGTVGLAL